MKVSTVNRLTGEIYTFPATTPDEVIQSLNEVMAVLDAYRLLKSRLNERAAELWRQKVEVPHDI